MIPLNPSARGKIFILFASLFWSTGGLCIKTLDGYSPWTVLSGRSLVCVAFFLILLKGRIAFPKESGIYPVIGSVAYALVVSSFVLANRTTTAANAIILQYTAILWIAILGWAIVRERPARREIIGVALGMTGVVLCMGEGVSLFAFGDGSTRALLGDLIALFSGLCFAIVTVVLRRIGKRTPVTSGVNLSLVCLFYGNVLAGLIGLPWFVSEIGTPGIQGQSLLAGWLVLGWLGAGQLGMGYWFYQLGLRTTRALTASLLSLVEPIINPLLVAWIIREIPSTGTIIGGGMVLMALVLALTAKPQGEVSS